MLKFLFDRLAAFAGIVVLSPLLLIIVVAIIADSRGGAFFVQTRVGKDGIYFGLYKFRTMRPQSESAGKLTIGSRDPRITGMGYFLRKYKLDELPQLLNVLFGDMSLVGPRPEVPEFVALYSEEQRQVLNIRPGITDYASLKYFHESELLAASANPKATYIAEVMPAKLSLNLEYMAQRSFIEDLKIIGLTIGRIFL